MVVVARFLADSKALNTKWSVKRTVSKFRRQAIPGDPAMPFSAICKTFDTRKKAHLTFNILSRVELLEECNSFVGQNSGLAWICVPCHW